jgi:succinate dehydrogenase hydrophobic anchor subunit
MVSTATMRVTPADTVIVTMFHSSNGSWTIMLDSSNGMSCMVLWGKHWVMHEEAI